MIQDPFPYRWQHPLPTMYDLPSEDPEEPGLPDEFHAFQPTLLSLTCHPTAVPREDCFTAQDLNLYYDPRHPLWHKRPDWFVVIGANRVERQEALRLSYVVWQEGVMPFLVVELLSPGTEAEDLGQTLRTVDRPPTKWQVYEQILQIPYYVIYDRYTLTLRAFELTGGRYQPLDLPEPKLWLERLGLGLGVWQGAYDGVVGQWLRWYDRAGVWVPTPEERAEEENQRAEQERQRADQAVADLAAVQAAQVQAQEGAIARLLALGLTPEQVAAALGLEDPPCPP